MTGGSSQTVTEQNRFVNCQRGVAYGWTNRAGFDHQGGVIRNNFFYRAPSLPGEAAVMVFDSPGTKVLQNSILLSGTYATPIEYAFPDTVGVLVANNLLDGSVWARDGAVGQDTANDGTAAPAYFVDAAGGDLHLRPGSPAVGAGQLLPDVGTDVDGEVRPGTVSTDMGADQTAAGGRLP
jgi:hypothetical protein